MIEATSKTVADWIGDREGEYDYFDNTECPLAQFLKDNGAREIFVGGHRARYSTEDSIVHADIDDNLSDALHELPWDWQELKSRLLVVA